MMSFSPGQRPPHVTIPAVVRDGSKKSFPRGPANSVPLDGTFPPAGNPLVSRPGRDRFQGFHDRDLITGLDPAGLDDRDFSPDTTPPPS